VNHEDRNILIEQHLPRIRVIARTFRSPLPPGIDVEDLVQEAAARMARHLDRGFPWTWARVEGVMLDALRTQHPGCRGPMPLDVASAEPSPEQLAIRSDRRRILQRNAATLAEREQVLLRLASRGASGQRIAQELRVSARRSRKIKERVVARLRAAVAA
jgi:RNA polymerase sigma factor (sigma-70 family)